MLRSLIVAAATAAIGLSLVTTEASARGGFRGGPGFHSGFAFRGGPAFVRGPGFRYGPRFGFVGPVAIAGYPYGYTCLRRVWTNWGWSWVNVCAYPYAY